MKIICISELRKLIRHEGYLLVSLYFILFFCFSCAKKSNYQFIANPVSDISKEVNVIDSYLDKYGLLPSGVNTFYRTGYYIIGLEKHGLLTSERVEKFCNALELSKFSEGFKRYPEYDESKEDALCTRDDYKAIWQALYYGQKYHQCAKNLIEYAYYNGQLSNDVWLLYGDYKERTLGTPNNALLADLETYLRAKSVCSKPENETSDKLQFALELIAARESPTGYSRASDEYCHSKVDFDKTLDIYYGENREDCPYCTEFKTVLKGIL